MSYVKTALSGLSAIRFENGDESARSTGYVPPAPIIGQTVQPIIPPESSEAYKNRMGTGYSEAQWAALGPIGREFMVKRKSSWGRSIGTAMEKATRAEDLARAMGQTFGRGFVPVVRDTILSTVIPGAPTFEVDDSRIERRLLPSILPAETRLPIVSEPTEAARSKLAFELAEAKKWGYTHTAWMALGFSARGQIRAKHPDGYKPVMRDGVSAEAARIDLVAGRDPERSKIHASGAGDYPGGIEFADPPSTVPLVSTKRGVTFDDILRIDPLKIQTPAEAAGIAPGEVPSSTQDIMRYGLMAVAGWILWDMFVKPKKRISRRSRRAVRPARRRKYPHGARKRHLRQGWQ
jgi:hypothetical protein